MIATEANAGILRYLAGEADPRSLTLERPSASTHTWRLGAHPDVVEHLWTRLNGVLPADARYLVAGGAALAHPTSGVILALALGTRYAVRLTSGGFDEALRRGHQTRHTFATVGRSLDLGETFGPGWLFGRYDDDEPRWLMSSYEDAAL